MIRTILSIDGMMCGMCESHINDCIRRDFAVKKITSSHAKGQTVILSETPLDAEKLKKTIADTGYTLTEIREEEAEQKTSFLGGLFHKK